MSAVAELSKLGLTVDDVKRLRRELIDAQDPPLWIYAIQAGGYGGDIKLGISRAPIARLATLQVGCSEELQGIAAWRALPAEEKLLHEDYASSRIRGEWFMHSLPLYRYLKAHGGDFRWTS